MKDIYTTPQPNRYLMQPSGERFGHIADFVPRPARDADEIERRKRSPRGTLVLDMQTRGLEIIASGLDLVGDATEAADWANCMAIAGLGTSPYLFNGPVMHRYVDLPILATRDPANRPGAEELVEQAKKALLQARDFSRSLAAAHALRIGGASVEDLRLKTGRSIAKASFLLTCIEHADQLADPTNALDNGTVQLRVRDAVMDGVQRAGTVSLEIGAFPSAAQLADPLSPLGVEIQRAGNDTVVGIYESLV